MLAKCPLRRASFRASRSVDSDMTDHGVEFHLDHVQSTAVLGVWTNSERPHRAVAFAGG